jgi:hypothetical protein
MGARDKTGGYPPSGASKGDRKSAQIYCSRLQEPCQGVCGASVFGSFPESLEQILSQRRSQMRALELYHLRWVSPPVDLARLTLRRTSWTNRSSRRVLTQTAPRRQPVVACCLGVCLVFVGLEGRGARQGSLLVYAAWWAGTGLGGVESSCNHYVAQ